MLAASRERADWPAANPKAVAGWRPRQGDAALTGQGRREPAPAGFRVSALPCPSRASPPLGAHMAKHDDDGVAPRDALGVAVTVGARVVYATGRGGGLLKEGVITRVQPSICIRRPDRKVITLATAKRLAVFPRQERDAKPQSITWAEFCRRNQERSFAKWADEQLRLAQERLNKRAKEQGDGWWT